MRHTFEFDIPKQEALGCLVHYLVALVGFRVRKRRVAHEGPRPVALSMLFRTHELMVDDLSTCTVMRGYVLQWELGVQLGLFKMKHGDVTGLCPLKYDPLTPR